MKLRALEPDDLEALYELENDESLWPSSSTHAPYSRYALSQFIATTQNNIYQDGQLRLVACAQPDSVLGMVDLFDFDPQHGRAEVGIGMLPAARGRGFGHSALLLLMDYVRRHLRLHQLYARVDASNTAALRLFEGCGFTSCGILKDWIARGQSVYGDAVLLQYIYK